MHVHTLLQCLNSSIAPLLLLFSSNYLLGEMWKIPFTDISICASATDDCYEYV